MRGTSSPGRDRSRGEAAAAPSPSTATAGASTSSTSSTSSPTPSARRRRIPPQRRRHRESDLRVTALQRNQGLVQAEPPSSRRRSRGCRSKGSGGRPSVHPLLRRPEGTHAAASIHCGCRQRSRVWTTPSPAAADNPAPTGSIRSRSGRVAVLAPPGTRNMVVVVVMGVAVNILHNSMVW